MSLHNPMKDCEFCGCTVNIETCYELVKFYLDEKETQRCGEKTFGYGTYGMMCKECIDEISELRKELRELMENRKRRITMI